MLLVAELLRLNSDSPPTRLQCANNLLLTAHAHQMCDGLALKIMNAKLTILSSSVKQLVIVMTSISLILSGL